MFDKFVYNIQGYFITLELSNKNYLLIKYIDIQALMKLYKNHFVILIDTKL